MLKSIWFLSLLCLFSGVLHAEDIKILQFKQAINLNNTQTLDLDIKGVEQDTSFWTAVYLVAQQGKPDGQATLSVQVQNEGAVNVAHPAANPYVEHLKAEQLPRAKSVSLVDLPELSRNVKQLTRENIDSPALPEDSAIRAYVQLLDWTPSYNQGETIKLSFSFPAQEGLYAVAAYVMVGQGKKPKELLQIVSDTPKNNQIQPQALTVENATSEASGVVPQVQTQTAGNIESDGGEGNRTRMLLASLAIILLGYWLWRRRR